MCELECAVSLGRRAAAGGRCAKHVHLRKGKSQDIGLTDVSSDGAQTLGRLCYSFEGAQGLSKTNFIAC